MAEALDTIAPGKPAPEIVGRDVRGHEFKLSGFRGKVVLLNFSAKWCLGCVKMYPFNKELIRRLKDEPFVLLGVNADEGKATLQQSIDAGNITWECWWDGPRGPIASQWQVPGWPTYIAIDEHGIIRRTDLTKHSPNEIRRVVENLVAEANVSDRKN